MLALAHSSRFDMETPLNIIMSSLELVLDQEPNSLNHQNERTMKRARKAIKAPMAIVAEIKQELY